MYPSIFQASSEKNKMDMIRLGDSLLTNQKVTHTIVFSMLTDNLIEKSLIMVLFSKFYQVLNKCLFYFLKNRKQQNEGIFRK